MRVSFSALHDDHDQDHEDGDDDGDDGESDGMEMKLYMLGTLVEVGVFLAEL